MLNFTQTGAGRPLLLLHGLGGTHGSWGPILPDLARTHEIISPDLPGHGDSLTDSRSGTFKGITDGVESFIAEQGLDGIDVVGHSLGARVALELARRGKVGATVALNPGGFWRGWERTFIETSLISSLWLVRSLEPVLPALTLSPASRSMLLAQLSARPWALDAKMVAAELRSFAKTPTFGDLAHDLAAGPFQEGPAADPSQPITIGWGRSDRLCLPWQAYRAQKQFPGSRVHWLGNCGHYPVWDQPAETVRLILATIDR